MAQNCERYAQQKDQECNGHLPDVRQDRRAQEKQHDQQHDHGQGYCNNGAPVRGVVQVFFVQQAKGPKHFDLAVCNTVTFPDDVLPLQICNRLNSIHRSSTSIFQSLLIDDHIRFEAEYSRKDILNQGNIHLVSDDLQNILDLLFNLPFMHTGIHFVFDSGCYQPDHLLKLIIVNAEDRNDLVPFQRKEILKTDRIGDFIFCKGFALG